MGKKKSEKRTTPRAADFLDEIEAKLLLNKRVGVKRAVAPRGRHTRHPLVLKASGSFGHLDHDDTIKLSWSAGGELWLTHCGSTLILSSEDTAAIVKFFR